MRVAFYAVSETVPGLAKRLARDGVQPLTDDDLIDDVLRFANARGPEFAGLVESAVAAASRVDAVLSAKSGNAQTIGADYTRSVAPIVQRWTQDELAKIVSGKGSFERLDSARLALSGASATDQAVIIEGRVEGPRRATIERRFAFASLEEFAQWSVLRMRDGSSSRELCRCRLKDCERFFLAIDSGGRTRRTYCSAEHMEQAHAATAAKRVAESRAKRKGKR